MLYVSVVSVCKLKHVCLQFVECKFAVYELTTAVQGSLLTEIVNVKSRFTSDSTYVSVIHW